ncbi:MAG: DUF1801 domain-containing protein [Bacteroidia bacterium]
MAELKTQLNDGSVEDFLNSVEDEQKRADSFRICEIMEEITGEPGQMWGSSIVGFGSYHYKYASGREGDWMLVGFSPRKQNLTMYVMDGVGTHDDLLAKLGKFKTGKSCLYVKRLSDIDEGVLRNMIERSVERLKKSEQ